MSRIAFLISFSFVLIRIIYFCFISINGKVFTLPLYCQRLASRSVAFIIKSFSCSLFSSGNRSMTIKFSVSSISMPLLARIVLMSKLLNSLYTLLLVGVSLSNEMVLSISIGSLIPIKASMRNLRSSCLSVSK